MFPPPSLVIPPLRHKHTQENPPSLPEPPLPSSETTTNLGFCFDLSLYIWWEEKRPFTDRCAGYTRLKSKDYSGDAVPLLRYKVKMLQNTKPSLLFVMHYLLISKNHFVLHKFNTDEEIYSKDFLNWVIDFRITNNSSVPWRGHLINWSIHSLYEVTKPTHSEGGVVSMSVRKFKPSI